MFYVYLLKNEKNEIYIGWTKDLKRRLLEHNNGESFSTKGHKWKLVYYEAYLKEEGAKTRERRLKHYGQALAQLKRRISS